MNKDHIKVQIIQDAQTAFEKMTGLKMEVIPEDAHNPLVPDAGIRIIAGNARMEFAAEVMPTLTYATLGVIVQQIGLLMMKETSKQQRLSMKKNSFDLSGRIEPSLLDVVEVVTQVAGPLSIPFFLIEATVRDLFLATVYGINTIRTTADIDFAICISDWDQF